MEVTYIGHSGFLLEWENCYWLFDYYKGDIPELKADKKLFVFSSHKHYDHFNPEVLKLGLKYPETLYVLSSDIKITNKTLTEQGVGAQITEKILPVKPLLEYELKDEQENSILLKTLKSTDCGVAFLLQYQGKTIYHAGDLHLWVWTGSTKQENNNMTAKFNKEMETMKDLAIDVAFAPLDPRLEENYAKGLESLLSTANIRYLFPMHMWDKPSVLTQFKEESHYERKQTMIMDVSQEGESWKLEL